MKTTKMERNNELYHYGVPGMKWGVRRTRAQVRTDTINRQTKKLSKVSDIGKHTSNAFNNASDLAGRAARSSKPSKKVRNELSKMSDQELRSRINRIQMEQQYASLNPSKVSRGASYASGALAVIGSLAAIGGSIASIAIATKQLKA